MKISVALIVLALLLGVTSASGAAPVVSLVSMPDIYQNSTGDFNVVWGITHDAVGLNLSTLAIVHTSYNNLTKSYRHSIRPPSNNKSEAYGPNGNILRADNRNKSLNFEGNTTITEGNVWKWGGVDVNCSRVNTVNVNSTYTLVYYNGSYQCTTFNTVWYLDRQETLAAAKQEFGIKASSDVALKIYDPLMMQGHDKDFVIRLYIDSSVIGNPTDPLEAWWANDSWDPTGSVDVCDSPYATLLTTFNATTWIDHSYSSGIGNDYVEIIGHGNASEGIIHTNESWVILKTAAVSGSHCYRMGIIKTSTVTNVTVPNMHVMFTGSSPPYTDSWYKPNSFICQIDSDEFIHKLFVADNNSGWGNLTVNRTIIPSYFDPSIPGFCGFKFEGYIDKTADCTYRETIKVRILVANDPDTGTVTHNLTLCKSTGEHVATINDTFTNNDADGTGSINITFNTASYYSTSQMYTLKCVATDDEFKTSIGYLLSNFSLSPLATSGNILDDGRLVFWGYNDVPALYTAVGDDSIISLSGGIYTFNKGIHMSQYQDSFLIDEDIHITSINLTSTPYFRWTGSCNITAADITSWKAGAPAPQTDSFRSYITSDKYYSESTYINDSDISNLGKGTSPLTGIYLNGLSGTLIDNNLFLYNQNGIGLISCDNITLSNNTIVDAIENSIHIAGGNGNNTVRDSIIYGTHKIGMFIDDSYYSKIYDNIISDTSEYGIKLIWSDNNMITDNRLYYTASSPTTTSITATRVDNLTVDNNIIEGGNIGMYSKYLTNSSITNNVFYNIQYGTTLSSGCDLIDISNNKISAREDVGGNPGVGILMMYGENTANNNTITVSDGRGIWIWGYCDDSTFENNSVVLTDPSFYCYMLDNAATGIEILNPADDIFTVKVTDSLSEVVIRNTDSRVFSHDSLYSSYGYTSGNFQLYVDDSDSFTIKQYDYTLDFASTSNITAQELSSGNLARFTINSGIVESVNVSEVVTGGGYNLDDLAWNVLESQTAVGGYVEFINNLFVGSYLVVPDDTSPPVITNIEVYNIHEDAASIRWNTDELSNNYIYYSMNEDEVIAKNCSVSVWDNSTANPNIRLTGLISSREYFFQVYSVDYYNNSNLSSIEIFTTDISRDRMPLVMYIIILILTFGLIAATALLRDSEKFLDVATSLLATFIAFMASQLSINGKVYSSTVLLDSADTAVVSYEIFNSLPLHYFMLLVAVIMVLYSVLLVVMILSQTYKNIIERRYDL